MVKKVAAAGLVALSTAAGMLSGASPAAASLTDGDVTCEYVITTQWSGGFIADLSITNRGPAINGWTARWSMDHPTSGVVGWSAQMSQQGSEIIARNVAWNAVINPGQTLMFGWAAAAQQTSVPAQVTLNGVPCRQPASSEG